MGTLSTTIAAVTVAAALVTAGCASGPQEDSVTPTPQPVTQAPSPATEEPEPTEEPTQCDKLRKADIKTVKFAAKSKKTDITAGAALPLPEELDEYPGHLVTVTRIIALEVETPDGPAWPVFATDDDSIELIGVNEDAIKHFHTLGGITTEPGTPIQDYRDQLAESDEADAVEYCVVEG